MRRYGLLCFWICGVENVSAYIFHDEFFFSFKRILVQGRRPCFRRLYRRLCFVKCKRLHFTRFCVSLDKFWVHRGQNRTEFGQTEGRIGQMDKKMDKWTKPSNSGQKPVNPLIRLGFRLFCRHFCPILSNLDKLVDKNAENPWYDWVYAGFCPTFCPLVDKRDLQRKRLNSAVCERFFLSFVHLSRISKL